MSDENLFKLCKFYGERTRFWRQKFIGLLPEVFKRKLYEKKGFSSVFEFAKKLAGLSEEQVRLTLNLEKRFENLPKLKNLLTNGEVSVNKLARMVSVANSENEEFWAENLKNLSKKAVETLVRDEKWLVARTQSISAIDAGVGAIGQIDFGDTERQNALFEPKGEHKSLPGQTSTKNFWTHVLNLSTEVYQKLSELQQKGIDINQLLLEFLRKREQELTQKKEQVRQTVLQKEKEKTNLGKENSRYLSAPVKKILAEEYGTKCALKGCQKQSVQIHHTIPFSISRSHNPNHLLPLCEAHHELQHAVNFKYQKLRESAYLNSTTTGQ